MTISVAAAIIKLDDKYMIARRASHKYLGGFWEFPGGKIEPHESAEHCLKRELEEELRIEVRILSFLAENTHDYGKITILLKAFLCQFIAGEFTLTDHDKIKWVKADELKNFKLAPADVYFLSYLSKI